MSPPLASRRRAVLAAFALLAGCAAPPPPPPPPAPRPPPPPPDYVVDGKRRLRADAEAALVGRQFAGQWPLSLDERPRILAAHLPDYPAPALRAGAEGVVRLQLHVAADGQVDELRLIRSTGKTREHRLLDAAVADAARRWRFTPLTTLGAPADAWLTFEYVFRLAP